MNFVARYEFIYMKSRLLKYVCCFCCLALLVGSTVLFSQDTQPDANKFFIIVASKKNLTEVYEIARTAERKTGIHFRDTKVKVESQGGLTFPLDTCTANGFSYPCYVPRGRYDDGIYFTIESSDWFDGFSKGYFMVIAGSSSNSDELKSALNKLKPLYPDAYIKNSKVYMGCIH